MGFNFEALGAPCLFLGALWVAGLPGGAQNELIELPVQAAAPIYRDSVDSGGAVGLGVGGGWGEGYPPCGGLWDGSPAPIRRYWSDVAASCLG